MDQHATPEPVRVLLARAGLRPPDERIARLAAAVEMARVAGQSLAGIEMGFRGPPPFRPPGPADG